MWADICIIWVKKGKFDPKLTPKIAPTPKLDFSSGQPPFLIAPSDRGAKLGTIHRRNFREKKFWALWEFFWKKIYYIKSRSKMAPKIGTQNGTKIGTKLVPAIFDASRASWRLIFYAMKSWERQLPNACRCTSQFVIFGTQNDEKESGPLSENHFWFHYCATFWNWCSKNEISRLNKCCPVLA